MPRLSNKQYQRTHQKLKHYWLRARRVYGRLTPTEQWQLHDYFQFSKELTTDELLDHRRTITVQRPSLPHHAGRALAKCEGAAANYAVYALQQVRRREVREAANSAGTPIQRTNGRGGHVTARGVVNPEPDAKAFARALIQLAKLRQQADTNVSEPVAPDEEAA